MTRYDCDILIVGAGPVGQITALLLAQQGLHQVQAADDLDVLVPVADLAHGAGQVGAELRGPGPREVGPAAGGHVLRDSIE